MKIKVDSGELRDMLAEMTPFSRKPKKDDPGQPAVMTSKQGVIVVETGDFHKNHYCQRIVSASIEDPGEAGFDLVSCAAALSIVDGEVEIEIRDGESGSIQQNTTNLAFRGSGEKIWTVDPPTSGWSIIEDTKPIVDAARVANKCRRQDDDIRYAINSLCLYPGESGLELVGTDGIILVSAKTSCKTSISELIVAQPSLAAALSTLEQTSPFEFHASGEAVWLRQDTRLNAIPKVAGKYPDYKKYVDKNATPIGILNSDNLKKLSNVLSRKVIKPTPQGLVMLECSDRELKIRGKFKNRQLTLPIGKATMEPCATAADQLARALSLFKHDAEMFHSSTAGKDGHLYLRDESLFVMLSLKRNYFKN